VRWAFDFDTVALRFRNMSLKSVLFIAYDIYTEGMTDYIEDASIPSIYLYPAKSKAENYVKYETKRKGKSDNLD
jgi:hypothetical protein